MYNKQDNDYVLALLIDRQERLSYALHSSNPHSVLQPNSFAVQVELDQVTAVLDKVRQIKK